MLEPTPNENLDEARRKKRTIITALVVHLDETTPATSRASTR